MYKIFVEGILELVHSMLNLYGATRKFVAIICHCRPQIMFFERRRTKSMNI